jgi:hypothetical protein
MGHQSEFRLLVRANTTMASIEYALKGPLGSKDSSRY